MVCPPYRCTWSVLPTESMWPLPTKSMYQGVVAQKRTMILSMYMEASNHQPQNKCNQDGLEVHSSKSRCTFWARRHLFLFIPVVKGEPKQFIDFYPGRRTQIQCTLAQKVHWTPRVFYLGHWFFPQCTSNYWRHTAMVPMHINQARPSPLLATHGSRATDPELSWWWNPMIARHGVQWLYCVCCKNI
jgi:hypothetical protein